MTVKSNDFLYTGLHLKILVWLKTPNQLQALLNLVTQEAGKGNQPLFINTYTTMYIDRDILPKSAKTIKI